MLIIIRHADANTSQYSGTATYTTHIVYRERIVDVYIVVVSVQITLVSHFVFATTTKSGTAHPVSEGIFLTSIDGGSVIGKSDVAVDLCRGMLRRVKGT